MAGTKNRTRRALVAIALACAGLAAQAAGGHHAVDDATILGRGECEQDTWASRAQGGGQLLHAGLSCRAGPVELGGAGEHVRGDEGSATSWQAEVKWAHEIADGLGFGLDVQRTWAARQSQRYV